MRLALAVHVSINHGLRSALHLLTCIFLLKNDFMLFFTACAMRAIFDFTPQVAMKAFKSELLRTNFCLLENILGFFKIVTQQQKKYKIS